MSPRSVLHVFQIQYHTKPLHVTSTAIEPPQIMLQTHEMVMSKQSASKSVIWQILG